MLESEFVIEGLSHQISFSYTSSSIDGDKLRLVFSKGLTERLLFCYSSYQHSVMFFQM